METLFSLLSACTSQDPFFSDQKDGYLQEQIRVMEAEVNRKPPQRERPAESRGKGAGEGRRAGTQEQEWQVRAELLEREVESLKN